MPRPRKCRRVCSLPKITRFAPKGGSPAKAQPVIMTLDEYETIRLIDQMGFTQEECAAQMQVARTTVQAVYITARRKLAQVIIEGAELVIQGGDFALCPASETCCGKSCRIRPCPNRRCFINGGIQMKIAVTYEDGMVFGHFGHTAQFKLYTVENGTVVSSQVVDTNGSGHGALAGFLQEQGVDTLLCGGIGGGARSALKEAGITLYPGVTGNADQQVEALLAQKLEYNPDTVCAHHHGDHGEGHCHEDKHGCGGSQEPKH